MTKEAIIQILRRDGDYLFNETSYEVEYNNHIFLKGYQHQHGVDDTVAVIMHPAIDLR